MSVSIVTFAALGDKRNFKTTDIEPVIRTFDQHGVLKTVICERHRKFYFPRTQDSLPWIARIVTRVLARVGLLSREQDEALFDFFAARKLPRTQSVFLHGGDILPRTARRARNIGSIVVNIAVMAHLATFSELEHEEFVRLGLTVSEGVYTRMQRRSQNSSGFDYVIALSEFARDTYVEHGFPSNKIYIAHPDIDLKRFIPRKTTNPDSKFRVLYVGYSTVTKGLHYLLEAWQQAHLPNAELALIGSHGFLDAVLKKRYDDTINNDSSITAVGDVRAPETHFASGSVLVMPSLAEGFGRVTLEAMACGIPVITTENARGIVEDGKTGFVVPIRDSRALADKIRYLYEHRGVAERMGKEARKAVENKKPFGEAVYEIYQEIMRREGRSLLQDL
jgi:glycosyltransferase involved in cell wall biosynthesis